MNEKNQQVEKIDKLLKVLRDDTSLDTDKKDEAIRNLSNVKEEISEQNEPDKSRIVGWLGKGREALQGLKLGNDVIEQAKELFGSFGIQ